MSADAAADPERYLATYHWRYDPDTLREIVDNTAELRVLRESLSSRIEGFTDNTVRARLLGIRAVTSRLLGDLRLALADGRMALAHAEASGSLRRVALAQARLAHIHQWRGEYAEADRLYALANSDELPAPLRASLHHHAGRSAYEQHRYMEACHHFDRALELRKGTDPELVGAIDMALDAVARGVAERGWGAFPRGRDEILQVKPLPLPDFDGETGLWGYANAGGDILIPAAYADVEPFAEGLAWVRRPDADTWEAIDLAGKTVIKADAGFRNTSMFSDGLAWVSGHGTGGWVAVDRDATVRIKTGYDDVRPFRRGVAAVRRDDRWGAVDASGRVVLSLRYDGFATALADGRYVDGFTDEGLAVVNKAGGKGVVDRNGRIIVEPAHPNLVIHPVAYLISSRQGLWGALDRAGRPLIDPVYSGRNTVVAELDRLLADTRPTL